MSESYEKEMLEGITELLLLAHTNPSGIKKRCKELEQQMQSKFHKNALKKVRKHRDPKGYLLSLESTLIPLLEEGLLNDKDRSVN